jgi:hypothetical protein
MNSPPDEPAETDFLAFSILSSGSKPLFEQLDLSRIGEARIRAE